ncbi:SprT-like domain-containing protein [Muricauda oceani]|nr:SprT-like domain-containing protein [Allomuricauda oceani]
MGEGNFGGPGTDGIFKAYAIMGKSADCPEENTLLPINEEEEKIINNLTGKAKCVYDKLNSTNLTELGIIQNTYIAFNDELNHNTYYLTYNLGKLSPNSDGTIPNGITKFLYQNNYEIILNTNQIDNRPPIDIARTILHESIHALLLKHQFGDGQDSFVELFKKYIKATTGTNDLHHSIMRDKYVIPIAKGLQAFDNSSENFSYYENLAWSGLHQELNEVQLNNVVTALQKAYAKGIDCN